MDARTKRWLKRAFIAFAALLAVPTAAALYLLTPGGQQRAQAALIATLTEEIGYPVALEGVALTGPFSLRAARFTLSGEEGAWLTAQNLSLRITPGWNFSHHITIAAVHADALTLHHTPGKAHPKPGSGNPGPDVDIRSLIVDSFTLGEGLGLPQPIRASLKGEGQWRDATESLHATLEAPIQPAFGLQASQLHLEATWHDPADTLTIGSLIWQEPRLRLSGAASLSSAGDMLEADLQLAVPQLSAFHPQAAGALTGQLQLVGDIANPILLLRATSADAAIAGITLPPLQLASILTRENGNLLTDSVLTLEQQGELHAHLETRPDTLLSSGGITAHIPALQAFTALPLPVHGAASLTAQLAPQGEAQSATVTLEAQNLYTPVAEAGSLRAIATLPNVFAPMPAQLEADIKNLTASGTSWSSLRLAATPEGEGWQATLDASGDIGQPLTLHAQGQGALAGKTLSLALPVLRGAYAGKAFAAHAPVTLQQQAENISLDLPKFTWAEASISLTLRQQPESLAAQLEVSRLPLGALWKDMPPALRPARATLSLTAGGTPAQPQAKAALTLGPLDLAKSATRATLHATGDFTAQKLTLRSELKNAPGTRASVNASLPLQLSLAPFAYALPAAAPLQGDAALKLDASRLAPLFLPLGHTLGGTLAGQLTLGGTAGQPAASGTLTFSGGRYGLAEWGVQLRGIEAAATLSGRSLTLTRLRGQDRQGNAFTASGEASFPSAADWRYRIEGGGKALELLNHPNVRATLTASMKLEGDAQGGAIRGTVENEKMDITLPDRLLGDVPQLNIVRRVPAAKRAPRRAAPETYPLALDMRFSADNRVFVRGWGVDAEFRGDLAIKGTAARPDIAGTLSTIRGRYEEFGKVFTLKSAELLFEGDIPPSPYVNVVATANASGAEIRPTLTGPLTKPELRIESTPAMPQEEALSVLLFGKDSRSIGALQAVQLADSLRRLSGKGGGGMDPVGRIRRLIGVDSITVNNEGERPEDASLGVGKYVNDKVYVEVEQGAAQTSSRARVEVELTPSVSVESSAGATGQNRVGLNWKKDY